MPIPGMPSPIPPQGQPPAMMRPPGATGAAMTPQPMAGAAQSGLAKITAAVKLLTEAMATLPIGGEEHKAVMKAISDLSKHVGETGDAGPAAGQQMSQMARQQQASPNAAILAKLMGGGGQGGPAPAQMEAA